MYDFELQMFFSIEKIYSLQSIDGDIDTFIYIYIEYKNEQTKKRGEEGEIKKNEEDG